jgi:hypothetical protein
MPTPFGYIPAIVFIFLVYAIGRLVIEWNKRH